MTPTSTGGGGGKAGGSPQAASPSAASSVEKPRARRGWQRLRGVDT